MYLPGTGPVFSCCCCLLLLLLLLAAAAACMLCAAAAAVVQPHIARSRAPLQHQSVCRILFQACLATSDFRLCAAITIVDPGPKGFLVGARRRFQMALCALVSMLLLLRLQIASCSATDYDGISMPIAATGPLAPWVRQLHVVQNMHLQPDHFALRYTPTLSP